jgi:two-component system chemotaxis sensor kinase CheA
VKTVQTPDSSATFLQEAGELLERIEQIALELEMRQDQELVDELFRAFHTIKGSGAMFGFDDVAQFTHHVESTLDKVRGGAVPVSKELVTLVLQARDEIQALLNLAEGGSSEMSDSRSAVIAGLAALSAAGTPSTDTSGPVARMQVTCVRRWRIHFRPDPRIMAFGTNLSLLFQELREMGTCRITANVELVPELERIQPEDCYLYWDIDLETDRDRNVIRDVFIFVEDGSELTIDAIAADGTERTAEPSDVAAVAQSCISETVPEVAPAQADRHPASRLTSAKGAPAHDAVVRVPSEKLDRLVNLVGELVMNQSRLAQAASRLDAPELSVPVEEIERLVSELRDNVLGIRMMPIGSTFGRFRRLVHDVSAEIGKEIDLITEGADTELDKSVLDQLGDPLVHLIRNSVDHGIEDPAEREKNGKPRRGKVTLKAVHTGSSVVVRIEDDGRGLDAAVLRTRAIEKRLISPDAELTEKELFNLIFLPGFSTVRQVTNLSGRGVGMDVVKRNIEALRGLVGISSVAGRGTAISLTLPLTLAIIDGLLVEIGSSQFIIPMAAVLENVELHRMERSRNNGRNVFAVRGELISYIRLRETFEIDEAEQEIEKIVIARYEDQHVGLVVDRVLGSHQTVIQSLGRFYKNIQLVSGATIMGDGRVALILNVPGLIQFAAGQCESSPAPLHAAAQHNQIQEVRV